MHSFVSLYGMNFLKIPQKGEFTIHQPVSTRPNVWTSSIKANPYRLLRVQRPVIFCANGPKKNTTQFNYENLLKADTLCSILQSPALTIGKKKKNVSSLVKEFTMRTNNGVQNGYD